MKKYILMFGLTLLVGLFISSSVNAQTWNPIAPDILWTPAKVGLIPTTTGITPDAKLTIYRTANTEPPTASQYSIMSNQVGAAVNFYKARGTASAKLAANANDAIGGLIGFQYNGTAFANGAAMRFVVESANSAQIRFQTNPGTGTFENRMIIGANGAVGINVQPADMSKLGTATLGVNGKILATEVEVKLFGSWPDFVFKKDYQLMPLCEVENFINENGHLPNVPNEAQVKENGINLGQMDGILLQKIEELTLHIIELNKRIAELEK